VIGGLAIATIATLFFVPTVFSVLHRNRGDHPPAISGMPSDGPSL
jgi:hypothetical protein